MTAADVGDFWVREAFRLAARDGWSALGSHLGHPGVELEFDGEDEAGLPLWERPISQDGQPLDGDACDTPVVDPLPEPHPIATLDKKTRAYRCHRCLHWVGCSIIDKDPIGHWHDCPGANTTVVWR